MMTDRRRKPPTRKERIDFYLTVGALVVSAAVAVGAVYGLVWVIL